MLDQPMLDQPLGRLARDIPGATRVFREHRLDFCCGGKKLLGEALRERGVSPQQVLPDLQRLVATTDEPNDWDSIDNQTLINHILQRYHQQHREQLPELIRLASRVEEVHGERADCPHGLARLLQKMHLELQRHMLKEEQVLFPILQQPVTVPVRMPVAMMREEHDQHGEALAELERLTHDIQPPRGACNTWRALYSGLAQFRDDLINHIHLENNVLFPRAESDTRGEGQ